MSEKPRIERVHTTHPGDIVIRRKERDVRHLRRVLGVTALFSVAYANIGSSIYYALGIIALYALGATPLALLIAGILFVFTAMSYAEGTVAIPEAGGASSLARHAFNEFISFISGWALILSYIVTISISAYSAGGYLSIFFPFLDKSPYDVLFAVGIILGMMALNVIGFEQTANFSFIFVLIDLLTQIVVVLFGAVLLLNPTLLLTEVQIGVAPTWGQLIFGISIATIAFTGIETVSNLAEETKNPSASIPRSFALAVVAILILYIGISTVALSAMPVHQVDGQYTTELSTRFIDYPVVGIAEKMPSPFSQFLAPLVAVLASFILIINTNTAITGISRASFSMGAYTQIPEFLHRVHRRFRTPFAAIIIASVVACILILPGNIALLADAYTFGAMLAFTIAHVSIIGLRIRYPEMKRPYKLSLNIPFRGREIPLISVIGGLGTFGVWLVIVLTHPFGRTVGVVWYVIGLILFVGYRRYVGLKLTESIKHPEYHL